MVQNKRLLQVAPRCNASLVDLYAVLSVHGYPHRYVWFFIDIHVSTDNLTSISVGSTAVGEHGYPYDGACMV